MSKKNLDSELRPVITSALSRRSALRGIGAVALSSTIFGGNGCGPADSESTEDAGAGLGATGTQPGVSGSDDSGAPDAGRPTNASSQRDAGRTLDTSSDGDAGAATDAEAATPDASSLVPSIDDLPCIATPEMTEGPFFVDQQLNRSDLVSGDPSPFVTSGLPFALTLAVYSVEGNMCAPLEGAQVDIWHANTEGLYSGIEANFIQFVDTSKERYLRAFQTTDKDGIVRFETIYPGWYSSRAIHIHFKVRKYAPAGDKTYEFISQVYMDESINDIVMATKPYATRGPRSVLNSTDQVFNGTGPGGGVDRIGPPAGTKAPGESCMLTLTPRVGGGYAGIYRIGLRMV